jgi:branched-chain amino acid transport system substrate-binding protein
MRDRIRIVSSIIAGLGIGAGLTQAVAQDTYVVGDSSGLTGYIATIDRAWTDGAQIAVDEVNADGGVLGKNITLVVEDNRAEPQEAVNAYRKMLSSDKAQVFVSGCLSAGNFAAAPMVVRQKIPMIVCSIIPKEPDQAHWIFSTIPPPAFEIEPRLAYLKDKTDIRKIGIIYDQSPYANVQTNVAKGLAPKMGIEVVGAEQYQQSDVDLSVYIKKLQAAGAEAILKMGVGPTTMTAAKNMRDMALDMPLLTSVEDLGVFREVADVLGDKFFFVANPTQIYDVLPDSNPTKAVIAKFLKPWQAKYGDRDPTWAGRGYDAIKFLAEAVRRADTTDGPAVRDALESLSGFQGTSGAYNFDQSHYGVTENPIVLAQYIDGKLVIVK